MIWLMKVTKQKGRGASLCLSLSISLWPSLVGQWEGGSMPAFIVCTKLIVSNPSKEEYFNCSTKDRSPGWIPWHRRRWHSLEWQGTWRTYSLSLSLPPWFHRKRLNNKWLRFAVSDISGIHGGGIIRGGGFKYLQDVSHSYIYLYM